MNKGDKIYDITKDGLRLDSYIAEERVDYNPVQLDRSVINPDQMVKVITAYRDAIYSALYPEREEDWHYTPKTLIFTQYFPVAKKAIGLLLVIRLAPSSPIRSNLSSNK